MTCIGVPAHSQTVLEAWHHLYKGVMPEGKRDEELKQLAHVTVSITNNGYGAASRTENLVEDFGIPQQRIEGIVDGEFVNLTGRQRSVVEFAATIASDPKRETSDDVQSLHDFGFHDAMVVESGVKPIMELSYWI